MGDGNDHIIGLREAANLSPDNIPLKKALGDALLGVGEFQEASQVYREALSRDPDHTGLKLGLARAFHGCGKSSQSLVIFEDLIQSGKANAVCLVFYARIMAGIGEVAKAVDHYRKGVQLDSAAADYELAARLGIKSVPPKEEESDDSDSSMIWSPDLDEVVDGKIRESSQGDELMEDAVTEIEKPSVNFNDVGGMESVKEEVRLKIIYPLTHAEMYKQYGKRIGGGILLYGPPGCGKTHLARATAGEVNAGFIAVGIHEVLDMWIGNSERNLHKIFEQARRNKPCVVFFDEVDALGASRSDMKTSAGRHLINQFLDELDGVKSNNDGVLILGATNAPWHLDSAFRRPGRFDRILFVPPPDAEARAEILRLQVKGKPSEDVDFAHVAKKCEGFSGADLKAVVDIATEVKLQDAMKTGIPKPIKTSDLIQAIKRQKPTTREWFATAKNYALYSNQGGVYDDILKFLKL